MIPLNKPFISGNENKYIAEAIRTRKLSGDGPLTKQATDKLLELHQPSTTKILLTTSCTDALEMCALLLDIKEGDEVIVPSYTFVSTALAFEMRGAKLVFADSKKDSPHIDPESVKQLITPRTKAIVPVHYAGIACDLMELGIFSLNNNIEIIEDNAQGITSKFHDLPLGTLGTLGTLSFHESKNINCGEGGALLINSPRFYNRAEVLREKGTNRSSFFRGEVNKYGWADLGSSYLPSDILAGFLLAQLESIDIVQKRRMQIFNQYRNELDFLIDKGIQLPVISKEKRGNGHIFYLVMESLEQRNAFHKHMEKCDVKCVFHYLSLHKSSYYINKYSGPELPNSDRYTDCLTRLPIYPDLSPQEVKHIIKSVKEFFGA